LTPALQAFRAQPMPSVRASAGQAGKLRIGKLFVSFQVACAFSLVVVGAAFLFSLGNLFRVDPGFDARNVAVLTLTADRLDTHDWISTSGGDPRLLDLMSQLQERVAIEPGVRNAASAWWPIFEGTAYSEQVILPGKGPSEQEVLFYRASPGYFATLGTPLLAGRDFQLTDSRMREPSPVVVNEAFARKYFGRASALGREFSYLDHNSPLRQVIVGVASDAHYWDLKTRVEPIVYLPLEGSNSFTLYVRSALPLGQIMQLVERDAHSIGSSMEVHEITTLETLVGNTLLREKLLAGVGGAFAFFGLLLAGIGLFGLLSYSVARRTKEIGIRGALGARRMQIISLVVKDVAALMTLGLMAGLGAALAVLTLFRSLLFGIGSADPVVTGTAIAVFFATGLVAASWPAHRAATVDPVRALREE